MRLVLCLIALAAVGGPAAASDSEYKTCLDRSDGTNAAWSECGGAMLQRADARLNAAWKIAMSAMPTDSAKQILREEQRAWNAYKEKACMIYVGGDYGRRTGADLSILPRRRDRDAHQIPELAERSLIGPSSWRADIVRRP